MLRYALRSYAVLFAFGTGILLRAGHVMPAIYGVALTLLTYQVDKNG